VGSPSQPSLLQISHNDMKVSLLAKVLPTPGWVGQNLAAWLDIYRDLHTSHSFLPFSSTILFSHSRFLSPFSFLFFFLLSFFLFFLYPFLHLLFITPWLSLAFYTRLA